jgi:hypothetical protein
VFLRRDLRQPADYFANPSLEPTSSGTARKPAVRQLVHRHTSGLRAAPPGSAQLER